VPWSRVVVEKLIVAANEAFLSFVGLKVRVVEVRSLYTCILLACVPFSVEKSLSVCVCVRVCVFWTYTDGNDNDLTSFSVDVKKKESKFATVHS
jgi:hypothetical protein